MKIAIVLSAVSFVFLACSLPGMEDMESEIVTISDRVDELEETAGNVIDSGSEEIQERIDNLEDQVSALTGLTTGIDTDSDQQAVFTDLDEMIKLTDSLSLDLSEHMELSAVIKDSIFVEFDSLYAELEKAVLSRDSLENRIDVLSGEVYALRTQLQSTTGRSGTTGGTEGRGGSGGSGTTGSGTTGSGR